MAKDDNSPRCEYCGWSGKSFPQIERHMGQSSACAAARAEERAELAATIARTQSNNAGPSNQQVESNVTVPSPRRSPSVTLEEIEDDYLAAYVANPPRRNPNAILEDSDDEDVPVAPPPRRSPSVTLEEIEDEYMAGYVANPPRRNPNAILEDSDDENVPVAPPWGPHPFAKPTRASLFAECHPDPTAGAAFHFRNVNRKPPPKYTSILAEPDAFREAKWLDHLPISRSDEAEYFSLPRNHNGYWKNLKEFEQEVNRLPQGPPWFRETIKVIGDQSDKILDLWKRNIIDIIIQLLSDPRFIPHTRFAPEKHYDSETRQNRVYGEMWSGRWWWRMQNIIGPYGTVVPIIISTDKTKLTVFSGNQKAWPVYISIGNISKDIRRCPSERATLLLGYIPVSNLGNISNERERSEAGWQLFHTCMESILEPLKTISRTGIDVLCADGGVRRVFPILAAYIADFPEQAMVACIRESCCPICWIPKGERKNLLLRYPLRDRCRTLDALDDHWNGYSHTIKILGICPTRPFWIDLPYVDISTCLAPDLLHQLDKGVFGDHIIRWTTILLSSNELDRRTKGMPRFQKLRHFARGISVISQWTGKEAKALGRTFMSIVAGHENSRLVKAVKSITDFMARAHKPEVTEGDLAAMTEDIIDFEHSRKVFIGKKKGMVKNEKAFNKIRKIHMLTHYGYLIRELGAPEGYNTEITERLHIDFVKKPWATTNHVNPIQQMVAHLENREAWSLLRAYMHDTGLVPDPRFQAVEVDDEDDSDGEQEDLAGGTDGGQDEVWQPTPTVQIAKRPSLGLSVRATYLINEHKATDLISATTDYLHSVAPRRSAFPISHDTVFNVWRRCKLRHRRLPFDPVLAPQTDQVRAFKTSTDSEGRVSRAGSFDVVLFAPNSVDPRLQGLHRLEAGQVRAIFALPKILQPFSSKKLVYLEQFCAFSPRPSISSSLYTTQHASEGRRRSAIVVPLSQLRMTCHLAPRYHLLDSKYRISSSTDLLSAHRYFSLNNAPRMLIRIARPLQIVVFLATRFRLFVSFVPISLFIIALTNMHASPHLLETIPSSESAQFRQLETSSALPPDPLAFNIPPFHSHSPPNLTSCFAAPRLSSVARSTNDINTYLSSAPLESAPTIVYPLDADHKLPRTRDRARWWATSTASGTAFASAPYLSDALNSFDSSRSSSPHDSAYGSGLVHRPNRAVNSRSATIQHPARLPRSDGVSHRPVDANLSGSEEGSASRYDTRDDSVGLDALDRRRQQIVESEQRRRNDLRGGFARLKDALPASHEKCSKLVLLDRAATYIGHLEAMLRDKHGDFSAVTDGRFARSA
ncbi:hypothetical protein FRC12_024886 [Ceratobasidium sp. 428]|nr:hypothetical protein FRC12_024886 [Ceratobasidium sp. 428]